ncbi:CRISPR type III-A/MTUBE-associated protein Csm6 [Pilibacter termitis]|uniref:CRISPR type III-A/MTUBE-associated protein Csm6 n=1 Tax=Pilibacter termitis TaxID=263852 RepID=A0A1T4NDR8_9ENTE|nr:type III-A CRISPR-associated CARF protein Csm6 [Pilibacter termitis]SJZ76948.1 CRISPR type III-A/MTUBE-associated protein Csm6 [Pilibacter termitis]
MRCLITCVGDTDPIRNLHDGGILHIARVYRPEKIILIHSERSLAKHENVVKALNGIAHYQPEILQEEHVLKNSEVFLFDKMFEQISSIVTKYRQTFSEDVEILLNLSSATPQVISAMFAINRIEEMNTQAIQVATPVKNSNEGVGHDNKEDIQDLIETNLDNQGDFENRCVEDEGVNFSQALLKRKLRQFIEEYDYCAAYQLIHKEKGIPARKILLKELECLKNDIQTQSIPEKIKKMKFPEEIKKSLNAYLLIDLKHKRGEVAEVLIRVKSFAEFVLECFFNEEQSNLIIVKEDKPYLNVQDFPKIKENLDRMSREKGYEEFRESTILSLPIYMNILKFLYPEDSNRKKLNKIQQINGLRNNVAHRLDGFDKKNLKNVNGAVKACRELLLVVFKLDEKYLNYYDDQNKLLLERLEDNH